MSAAVHAPGAHYCRHASISLQSFIAGALFQDVDVLIALKRKQKGHSEHYSLRDHGKAGVAGEQRLQDQERGEPDGQDAGDRGTGARGKRWVSWVRSILQKLLTDRPTGSRC